MAVRMNTYLARISECVHGYVSCTFGDCPGGTTTRIELDENQEVIARVIYYANLPTPSFDKRGLMVPFDKSGSRRAFRSAAKAVVDAALGGSEE
jgi:hypothetical protein